VLQINPLYLQELRTHQTPFLANPVDQSFPALKISSSTNQPATVRVVFSHVILPSRSIINNAAHAEQL
jgi:hypothetical protein